MATKKPPTGNPAGRPRKNPGRVIGDLNDRNNPEGSPAYVGDLTRETPQEAGMPAWVRQGILMAGIRPPDIQGDDPSLNELLGPVEFCERYLRANLWSKQREVLQAIEDHEKVAVKSAHQQGKTWLAAAVVPWWMFTRGPAYVVTTAPSATQVENLLWREIGAMWNRLPDWMRQKGECLSTTLKMRHPGRREWNPMHYAYGRATDRPINWQGEHKKNFLLIVDEANGIEEVMLDMMGTWGADKILLIGNPVVSSGLFFEAFQNPSLGYHTISINGLESPNFTDEEVDESLKKRLLSVPQVEQWAAKHGANSSWYRSRVLAEFPTTDETRVVVPLGWMEMARKRPGDERDIDPNLCRVGVDVSDSGDDNSVIVMQSAHKVIALLTLQGPTKTDLVMAWLREAILDFCDEFNRVEVLIDRTGVGAGVSNLMELESTDRVRFRGVHFSQVPSDKGQFASWRAEAYWAVRNAFSPHIQTSMDVCFEEPPTGWSAIDSLEAQLSEIRWNLDRMGRTVVEAKESMRRRLLRTSADGGKRLGSPDEADAMALAFCPLPDELEERAVVTPWDLLEDELKYERLGVAESHGRYEVTRTVRLGVAER